MWELLLRMILDTVTENRGVQVEFYNRFQYTVEVSAQSTSCHRTIFLAVSSFALFDCEPTKSNLLGKTCVNPVKIIITTVTIIL